MNGGETREERAQDASGWGEGVDLQGKELTLDATCPQAASK